PAEPQTSVLLSFGSSRFIKSIRRMAGLYRSIFRYSHEQETSQEIISDSGATCRTFCLGGILSRSRRNAVRCRSSEPQIGHCASSRYVILFPNGSNRKPYHPQNGHLRCFQSRLAKRRTLRGSICGDGPI